MNHIERLAQIFGSKGKLAQAWGVDRSLVSRLSAKGVVPPRHNRATRIALRGMVEGMTEQEAAAFIAEVEACLTVQNCPTCGHPIDEARVL